MNRNSFVICLFGILAYFASGYVAHESIIDGVKAENYEIRYQVSVQPSGTRRKCGGGIIGDEFILTAAHCAVHSVQPNGHMNIRSISVVAGTHDLHKNAGQAVITKVEKIYMPVEFRLQIGTTGDIAVLKLKDSLELSKNRNLMKLKLPNDKRESYVGKTGKIAGFGWSWIKIRDGVTVDGGHRGTQLRFAEVDIIDKCHGSHPVPQMADKRICAQVKQLQNDKPRGVCHGDSGGPLVYNETIVIGILSTTPRSCSDQEEASIYTRVTHYLSFIHNAMKNKTTKDMRVFEARIHAESNYAHSTESPLGVQL